MKPDKEVLKANDTYHAAIDLAMVDTTMDASAKAQLGSLCVGVFKGMIRVNRLLAEQYSEENDG